MTNQEAAEMIRNDMKLHHDYLSGQYRKALNMAINALLKEQEPKTIRGFADTVEGVVIGNCSRCGKLIVGKENDPTWFCKYCGQAVIWE